MDELMIMDYLGAYRGKTLLVTGGAGAIGSNLTRGLLGATLVLVMDDLSSASQWNVICGSRI
jgi:UDP-glucose 4-epimerase